MKLPRVRDLGMWLALATLAAAPQLRAQQQPSVPFVELSDVWLLVGAANPPGLYRTLVYSRPFEIVQMPDKLIQVFELGGTWRAIYADGRPVPDDIAAGPCWYGYSVGRWEGDTLVVTTLALDERASLDEWGTQVSAAARIEERWQRIAPDRMLLRITARDPVTYSAAWTSSPVTYTLRRDLGPQEIIFAPMEETACNESSRDPARLPKQ